VNHLTAQDTNMTYNGAQKNTNIKRQVGGGEEQKQALFFFLLFQTIVE